MKGLFFTVALACFAINMNVAVPIEGEPVQASEDNDIAKKRDDACKLFNTVINLVIFDGFKGNDTAIEVIKGCYGKYLNNLYEHVCKHALGEDADVEAAALEMHSAEDYCQMLDDYLKAKNDNGGDEKDNDEKNGDGEQDNENNNDDGTTQASDVVENEEEPQGDESTVDNAEVNPPTSNDGEASEKSKLSHVKSKGAHNKNKSSHNKNKSSHNKNKSSHNKNKNSHNKNKSSHSKSKGSHNKNKEAHHPNAQH